MQTLRNASFLVRLVLAWFALSIGVAVAAPAVNPQAMELVCSGGGGVKIVVQGEGGAVEMGAAALDCPLCAVTGPPSVAARTAPGFEPLAHALQPLPPAPIAALTAPPLPARGPPH